jgi:soluble lytic murein transglycosylase-like protein
MPLIKRLFMGLLNILNKVSFIIILMVVLVQFKMYCDLQQKVVYMQKPTTTLDSIVITLSKFRCPAEYVEPYSIAINNTCQNLKIDWKWVVAKIYCESYFDPSLKSFVSTKLKGDKEKEFAIGLMQIKPATAKEVADELGDTYTYEKLFDGVTNIRWSTYYFSKKLIRYYYNYEKAVRAYNIGSKGLIDSVELSDNHFDRVLSIYNKIGD